MKHNHKFLKHFPPILKEVFWEEVSRKPKRYDNTATTIDRVFVWSSTKLGHEFWWGVDNNIYNLEK